MALRRYSIPNECSSRGNCRMKQASEKFLKKAMKSIKTAEKLIDPEEAEFVATRAYYALFYVAEALLFERGLAFKKHSAVHSAFGEYFAKTGLLEPKFHRWLIEAFSNRISSDYDAEPNISIANATKMLQQAREFLEAAKLYLLKEET